MRGDLANLERNSKKIAHVACNLNRPVIAVSRTIAFKTPLGLAFSITMRWELDAPATSVGVALRSGQIRHAADVHEHLGLLRVFARHLCAYKSAG
jgi:hypothetical protein